jgi:hypothetical protein
VPWLMDRPAAVMGMVVHGRGGEPKGHGDQCREDNCGGHGRMATAVGRTTVVGMAARAGEEVRGEHGLWHWEKECRGQTVRCRGRGKACPLAQRHPREGDGEILTQRGAVVGVVGLEPVSWSGAPMVGRWRRRLASRQGGNAMAGKAVVASGLRWSGGKGGATVGSVRERRGGQGLPPGPTLLASPHAGQTWLARNAPPSRSQLAKGAVGAPA